MRFISDPEALAGLNIVHLFRYHSVLHFRPPVCNLKALVLAPRFFTLCKEPEVFKDDRRENPCALSGKPIRDLNHRGKSDLSFHTKA